MADPRAVQNKVAKGTWRQNSQSTEWVGFAVAEVLGLDADDKAHRERIKKLLRTWTRNGMFVEVEHMDDHRKKKKFVEVGEWADD